MEDGKVTTSSPESPETPEEELARLRVEHDSLLADRGLFGRTWSGWKKSGRSPAEGHEVVRGRDDLVIGFQFVDDDRDTHKVKRMCGGARYPALELLRVVPVPVGTGGRQVADDALARRVKYYFEEWGHMHRYRRITRELAEDPDVDDPVNHKRVARQGMVGVHFQGVTPDRLRNLTHASVCPGLSSCSRTQVR